MRSHILKAFLTLVVVGLLLGGLIFAGRQARADISVAGRFAVPFSTVRCETPDGMNRELFLAEVRYLASVGDRIGLLDSTSPDRLRAAFGRHPWVEGVECVVREGNYFRVTLRMRHAILAVPNVVGTATVRYVDRHGVLLPESPAKPDVPAITNLVPAPVAASGVNWADPTVMAAVRIAERLAPYQDRLRLTELTRTDTGWLLTHASGATLVRWGHTPGEESAGEASASRKIDELLAHCDQYGSLDRPMQVAEHDVRYPKVQRESVSVSRPTPPTPSATTTRRFPDARVVPRGAQSPGAPEPFRVGTHPLG
jgi:hypothetical protein